jgi:hypothetical protein
MVIANASLHQRGNRVFLLRAGENEIDSTI